MPKPQTLSAILRPYKRALGYLALFTAVINILMLVPPMYMLQIYDRVMVSRSQDTLVMLTLVVLWLFLALGLLEFVRSRLLSRIGAQIDVQLNDMIYSSMVTDAIQKPGQGSTQPLSDLSSIRQFITSNASLAFIDFPWIFVYVGIMFLFHPMFGWFALGAIAILIAIAVANELSTRKISKVATIEGLKSQQIAQSQLRGVEAMTAMGMNGNLKNLWLKKHLSYLEVQSEASDKSANWTYLSKNLRMVFQSLILTVGAYLAITNEITAGMLIAGSILLGRALAPIDQMIGGWKQFDSARGAYGRLSHLLNTYHQTHKTLTLPEPKGQIDVTELFVVPPGAKKPVINGVSFSLKSGEILGVIGASAAGKSTLAKALMGVWPTMSGKVRLDGAEFSQWDNEVLGAYLGYLPQDVELFDGTIAQNIARFGEIDDQSVVEAAQIAGVHQMILHLPNGYETHIGVAGVLLSGGQRQRIGLARAIYKRPKFMVLDEPNAHLDDAGELALAQAMAKLKSFGTTQVVITHRPGLLNMVDYVMVLKDGKVSVYGTKQAVLNAVQNANQQSASLDNKTTKAEE